MTRIGINPARRKTSAYKPARVTAVVLTYIPALSGYFKQRLEILQLTLESMLSNATIPFDLIVFDNGSCSEVTGYLKNKQQQGDINFLFLSKENIGKIGALQIAFNAVPGEIIAYSDDDILFYPGWLAAQLEILDSFPNAGMVSGVPVRNASKHANRSLKNLTEQHESSISFHYEHRIPDEWERDWAISTGRDPEEHIKKTQDEKDLVLRFQPPNNRSFVEAIGSANHFQFIAPKSVITSALPNEWRGNLMGSMIEMDNAVDEAGYLRLSTVDRFTQHIGNIISEDVLEKAKSFGISASATEIHKPTERSKQKHWLFHIPGARRVLTYIYNRIFEILYQ